MHRIPYISDVGHFHFEKQLLHFFRENNHYRIVHSHLDKMSGIVLRAAKKAGISIRISHSHNTRSEGGMAARVYKSFVGSLIRHNSTHHVACSMDAAKWLFKDRWQTSNIVRNGIEVDKFKYSPEVRETVRNKLKIDSSKFVLGHVGRFNHQKNHFFLLDVFSKVNKEIPETVLILIGDGELRLGIQKKIRDLKLEDKVLLLGVRSDVSDLLQAFDLFIFPSLHEGLPVSLIEAQGAGLPCLISDHISNEVDMGLNLIHYSSLVSIDVWIKNIKKIRSMPAKRDEVTSRMIQKGFDIRNIAASIEEYYYSISG